MNHFKSNSNFRYIEISLIVVLGLIAIWTIDKSVENRIYSISGNVLTIILGVTIIRYYLKKLFDIKFNDNTVLIGYKHNQPKKLNIDYKKIKKITLLHERGIGRTITLRFIDLDDKRRKIKFNTVIRDKEFMKFVKFIKSKNDDIEFKFLVPFSDLEWKYQKLYPTKFRKVLKSTL